MPLDILAAFNRQKWKWSPDRRIHFGHRFEGESSWFWYSVDYPRGRAWRDHWEEVADIVIGFSPSLEIVFKPR